MLKNKFKIITLLIVLILSLTIPIVRAENETEDDDVSDNDISLISEDSEDEDEDAYVSTETSEDNFTRGDVYLVGDDVTIDYIVDGNIFVLANSVTINSQIGGDAFVCAKSVNVGEDGYIFSNLFACAQDVTVSGVVYDLYTIAQEVNVNGYIYRDIRVSSNTLNINGIVGRNAFVKASNISFAQDISEDSTFTSQGSVNGDFNYTSTKELSIPEDAVSGSINYSAVAKANSNSNSVQTYILSLGRFIATVAILWLLCLWLAPKFLDNTNNLVSKKLLPVIGYGILTPIVAALAFIILLVLGITSNIALLVLGILLLLLSFSLAIFTIAMNNVICEKLKIQKNIGKFGMVIISSAVLWIINLIPYLGSLVSFVGSIIGLGLVAISIIPLKRKANKETAKAE